MNDKDIAIMAVIAAQAEGVHRAVHSVAPDAGIEVVYLQGLGDGLTLGQINPHAARIAHEHLVRIALDGHDDLDADIIELGQQLEAIEHGPH